MTKTTFVINHFPWRKSLHIFKMSKHLNIKMSNAATLWKLLCLVNFCICLTCIIKYSWWTPCKRQKCKKWPKISLTPNISIWNGLALSDAYASIQGQCYIHIWRYFFKNILTIQKHYDNLPKIALVSIILVQRKPDLHSERHLLTGKISVRDRLPIWNFTYFNVKIFEMFE